MFSLSRGWEKKRFYYFSKRVIAVVSFVFFSIQNACKAINTSRRITVASLGFSPTLRCGHIETTAAQKMYEVGR